VEGLLKDTTRDVVKLVLDDDKDCDVVDID